MGKSGVLLMGFGGPDSLDAVGPFMRNLMGREPSPELIERVQRRYLAIGGSSPLREIAVVMAGKLEEQLAERGADVPVRVGMRYWHPFIEEGLTSLAEEGCDRVVLVSLSPFESKVASGAYREAISAAAEELAHIEFVEAPLISTLPSFVDYLAGGVAVALEDLEPNEGAILAFTAHSLPESDLAEGDPYVAGLRQVAEALAEKLGLALGHEGAGGNIFEEFRAYGSSDKPRAWFLVYQSKGQKPGPWLGPDLDDLIDAAAASSVTAIVACPIGFATDHMETLYDLDIVAADKAISADLEFVRSPVPNDADSLVADIAGAVLPLLNA
jgi:ferrochelatase